MIFLIDFTIFYHQENVNVILSHKPTEALKCQYDNTDIFKMQTFVNEHRSRKK